MRWDVAGTPGVRVVAPCPSQIAGALEDDEIFHALLAQPNRRPNPAEATPDDGHARGAKGGGVDHRSLVLPRGLQQSPPLGGVDQASVEDDGEDPFGAADVVQWIGIEYDEIRHLPRGDGA